MFSFSRKIVVAAAGLAVMLGAGGVAFATSGDAPADGGKPAAIECWKAEHLEPGAPFVPAKPGEEGVTKPVEPGTPAVPAKPIEEVPTEPIECRVVDGLVPGVPFHPTEPGAGAPAEALPPAEQADDVSAEPVK